MQRMRLTLQRFCFAQLFARRRSALRCVPFCQQRYNNALAGSRTRGWPCSAARKACQVVNADNKPTARVEKSSLLSPRLWPKPGLAS